VVTPVRPGDHDQWAALFRAYGRTHRRHVSDETIAEIWGRLHDRDDAVRGLVVRRTYSGPPVGLAHYRAFVSTGGCYLDDLFVDPGARGGGAASAVLAHLRRLAAARGWGAVRWLTAADNEHAVRVA
jgi:GNAT superfamily N-acetyltransferase